MQETGDISTRSGGRPPPPCTISLRLVVYNTGFFVVPPV